jgi:hypothetical protein
VTLYLVTYRAIARNAAPLDLSSSLAAIPRDTDTEGLLGLDSLSDVTTAVGNVVTRSMSYTSLVSPPPMIPNPQLGEFLRGFYRSTFSQALSTPVTVSPVSTVPAPALPALWVRADTGVTSPVHTWFDLSGSDNDLVQAVVGRQPVQVVNLATDAQVIRFAGAGPNGLASSAPLAFDAFTYFVTFTSPLLSTAGFVFERSVDATAHSGENLYPSSGAAHSVLATRNGVTHSADLAANWGIDGLWHLAAYAYDVPTGGSLFVDNLAAPAASFVPLGAQAVSSTLFVGARGPAFALPLTADIREIMVFGQRFTAAELAAIAPYFKSQVGL